MEDGRFAAAGASKGTPGAGDSKCVTEILGDIRKEVEGNKVRTWSVDSQDVIF